MKTRKTDDNYTTRFLISLVLLTFNFNARVHSHTVSRAQFESLKGKEDITIVGEEIHIKSSRSKGALDGFLKGGGYGAGYGFLGGFLLFMPFTEDSSHQKGGSDLSFADALGFAVATGAVLGLIGSIIGLTIGGKKKSAHIYTVPKSVGKFSARGSGSP